MVIKKKEIFGILKKDLYEEYLKKHGFSRWSQSSVVDIYRYTKIGYDFIGISTTWYPSLREHEGDFGVGIRIKEVEEIMLKLAEKVTIKPAIKKSDLSFNISSIDDVKERLVITTEEDVLNFSNIIKNYLAKVGFKKLQKYKDLREIDRLINSFNDFWEDDWGKPYQLGGNFYFRRVVIARLSGNKRWLEVVERNYDAIDKKLEEQGDKERVDRKDTTKPLPYLVELLKNTKPLYPEYDPNEKKGILSRLGFKSDK